MNLPEGRLVHSRVVDGAGAALATALDRELTGYAVLAPQEALLGGDPGRGVLTFRKGAPVLAYHPRSDRGGVAALADLAAPGPWRCELYELETESLPADQDLRVPPGLPAERLAGDPGLASRTRERAGTKGDAPSHTGSLEAFLADEEKIGAIQRGARLEAERRATEWGLADLLDE